MKIISNIKVLMTMRRMTIRELQVATGLSTRTIHNARGEQIATCTLATLARFAQALGCSTKDLYAEGGVVSAADYPTDYAEAAEEPAAYGSARGASKKPVASRKK